MQTNLLQNTKECAKLLDRSAYILVNRDELEKEHSNLLERIHQLRRLLGYPALMTGKKRREQE